MHFCKPSQYKYIQAGRGKPTLYLNESGFYRLLLMSKTPVGFEVLDWVTEEVIPRIRTKGVFIVPGTSPKAIVDECEHVDSLAH
jgi:prophage antirepressor-like protein